MENTYEVKVETICKSYSKIKRIHNKLLNVSTPSELTTVELAEVRELLSDYKALLDSIIVVSPVRLS